jgi:hypothetical protein
LQVLVAPLKLDSIYIEKQYKTGANIRLIKKIRHSLKGEMRLIINRLNVIFLSGNPTTRYTMDRLEFKDFVKDTLEKLVLYAELHYGKKLPEELWFRWMINKKDVKIGKDDIIEEITNNVFLSEDMIYPCVDLVVEDIFDDRLLVLGSIAGYPPAPFKTGWSNRPGPFIYGLNPKFISPYVDSSSEAFKNKLKEFKLIYN